MNKMKKACVVRDKYTKEFYKFTLGKKGEIIILDSEYDLKNLIVSLLPLEEVSHLDNDYYVVGEYGK